MKLWAPEKKFGLFPPVSGPAPHPTLHAHTVVEEILFVKVVVVVQVVVMMVW